MKDIVFTCSLIISVSSVKKMNGVSTQLGKLSLGPRVSCRRDYFMYNINRKPQLFLK